MNNINHIKEKIKKLLSLSKSPNENEASLALNKAQELLRKHNLSIEEIYSFTVDNVQEDTVFSGKRIPSWIGWLASTIADIFEVSTFTVSHCRRNAYSTRIIQSNVQFVGFEVDIMIAKHCFEYIRRGIESGYQIKKAELKSMGQRVPRGFKNSYALGYINAVEQKVKQLARCKEIIQAEEYVSNLPVIKQNAIERYMQQFHLKETKNNVNIDYTGYVAGLEDGTKTPISRPVSGEGLRAIA